MLGLVGSLHCVGMCGPIAMALPYQSSYRWQVAGKMMLYQSGRILTYTLLGTVLGLFGMGMLVAGIQTYVSVILGVLLVLVALFSWNMEAQLLRLPVMQRLNRWVKQQLGQLLRKSGARSLFLVGMLNGLLPCGLVYMAIIGALTTHNVAEGAVYMASFGLGTLPLMLATSVAGQFIGISWRNRVRKLAPAVLLVIAFLLIMRGLNFYVPSELRFLQDMSEIPMCH